MKKIIFITITFLFSCQGTKDERGIVDSVVQADDSMLGHGHGAIEDFDEFYNRFNKDKNFQKSRIKYPLEGEFYDGTRDDDEDISYTWTERDSLEYNIIALDTNIYKFERSVLSDSLVVERVFIPNSGFQINARFKRINGHWFMIFFSSIEV